VSVRDNYRAGRVKRMRNGVRSTPVEGTKMSAAADSAARRRIFDKTSALCRYVCITLRCRRAPFRHARA